MENLTMVDSILGLINSGGIVGLLVLVLVGGYRRWWVYGREYDSVIEERNEWRRIALMSSDIAKTAVSLGSELVK